jgi:hypothetical protein
VFGDLGALKGTGAVAEGKCDCSMGVESVLPMAISSDVKSLIQLTKPILGLLFAFLFELRLNLRIRGLKGPLLSESDESLK